MGRSSLSSRRWARGSFGEEWRRTGSKRGWERRVWREEGWYYILLGAVGVCSKVGMYVRYTHHKYCSLSVGFQIGSEFSHFPQISFPHDPLSVPLAAVQQLKKHSHSATTTPHISSLAHEGVATLTPFFPRSRRGPHSLSRGHNVFGNGFWDVTLPASVLGTGITFVCPFRIPTLNQEQTGFPPTSGPLRPWTNGLALVLKSDQPAGSFRL